MRRRTPATKPSDGAYLRIRVVPRASRPGLSRDAQGTLRAHVGAPPVEGAANRALLALLADLLGLPKRALEIAHGERGRDKVIRVRGRSERELEERVARAVLQPVDKPRTHG